jgi:threonyl-tRNA synthetase
VRKVPYILVIGDREADAGSVAVRRRDGADCGVMSVADCAARLCEEVRSRSLQPRLGPVHVKAGTAPCGDSPQETTT